MNCRQAREIIAAQTAGDLAPQRLREMQEHIRTCEACAELDEQFRQTWDALSCHPTLEPSADFMLRLRSRIQAEEARESKARHFGSLLKWRWAALAVCALAAAVLLTRPGLFHPGAPVSQEPVPVAVGRDSGDEQLLRDLDKLLDYSAADALSAYDSWPGGPPEGTIPEMPNPIPAKKLMKKEPA
jgi:anti-sigma factor RsiW